MKVFWSWQSDTPGKTGRHFVRRALHDAIEELRQPKDIEEPSERDVKDGLHLDHDRLGVTGSPRLLDTIFKKIDACAVFVADVTPVSIIPAEGFGDDERPEKRNMNPNVAIELGYALKTVSELNVLMVLNTNYGARKHLPFDIQANAGPIMYNLPPDADATRIKGEAANLRGQFVAALRGFVEQSGLKATAPALLRTPSTTSPAVFFQTGEVLATYGEERDLEEYGLGTDRGVYFRMIPRSPPSTPISRTALTQALRRQPLDTLSSDGGGASASNRYGAAAVALRSVSNGTLSSLTQAFQNGELWGIAPWVLEEHGSYGRYIPLGAVERVIRRALPRYLAFAAELGVHAPFTLELGAVGVEGLNIVVGPGADDQLGPIYDPEILTSVVLNDTQQASQAAALLKLFQDFCAVTGYPRPEVVNGFPKVRG